MREYVCFPKFIFRTPTLNNLSYLQEGLVDSPIFYEAISVSSRGFRKILDLEKNVSNSGYSPKVRVTLNKYLARMCTKSTPLGIFAGIGVGYVSTETSIAIDSSTDFDAFTDFNFSFYEGLLEYINKNRNIRHSQKYSVNTSLFFFAGTYRYNERIQNGPFRISEIKADDFITLLIESCKVPQTAYYLAQLLVIHDHAEETSDALEFIDELINNNVLVSELDLSLTRTDQLGFLIKKLQSYENQEAEKLIMVITSIRDELNELNLISIGGREKKLLELENSIISKLNLRDISKAGLTNTTLFVKNNAKLEKRLVDKIYNGLVGLITLLSVRETEDLALREFKIQFLERYDGQDIPLLEALDPDIGVGFAQFTAESIQTDPIIMDFNINKQNNSRSGGPAIDSLLLRKFQNYLKNPEKGFINIVHSDLGDYPKNWYADLPNSFLVGNEIYDTGATPLIYLKFAGGTTGVNLINRFCKSSPELCEYVKQVTEIEESLLNDNTIAAEISYLPEEIDSSIILQRRAWYKYEIPIMNVPSHEEENVISPSDILVSIDSSNQIVLKSKKNGKRIIPKNTSAHDYSFKTNPLYYFLSSLQVHERAKFRFILDWEDISSPDGFFPRVCFEDNIILILARWKISKIQIDSTPKFFDEMYRMKIEMNIPDKVWLRKGFDSKILIDFNHKSSMDILRAEAAKEPYIVFEEYLFDNEKALISTEKGIHNNEIFLTFTKLIPKL
ncbi:lantibiotic dehydratase family protein [Pedobacter sp. 22163]|uniref:lantibiotic dehydratase family protein n=1 Tax=Pedobacter sp. 22163 TaxID=3453883 RepID=UPI003F860C1E